MAHIITSEPPLVATDLGRSYGDRVAVASFSVTVAEGELIALVGPNGCGKTTSVEMALGLRRRDHGTSSVCGHDPLRERAKVARLVGVQLQGAALHQRVKLREHFQYLDAVYGADSDAFGVAEAMGLGDVVNMQYGSLSGGMQRRALVASALCSHPKLAVLDEPTSGVDPESRRDFFGALHAIVENYGTGVLISTHDLQEAERYADRVLIMRAGQILADDTPAHLVAETGLRRVVELRAPRALPEDLDPGSGAVEIGGSTDQTMFGFGTQKRATEFARRVTKTFPEVRITERQPSLEDAYFLASERGAA